jgi:hypothetical protein
MLKRSTAAHDGTVELWGNVRGCLCEQDQGKELTPMSWKTMLVSRISTKPLRNNCRDCNRTFYADREASESIYRSIEQELDNPFLCNDCQQDYDESAYEDR